MIAVLKSQQHRREGRRKRAKGPNDLMPFDDNNIVNILEKEKMLIVKLASVELG
jgi:hypothetical protein